MSDAALVLIIVIVIVWVLGAHLGYWVGRVREQNRLIPEILEEREQANKLALLLKLHGGAEFMGENAESLATEGFEGGAQ